MTWWLEVKGWLLIDPITVSWKVDVKIVIYITQKCLGFHSCKQSVLPTSSVQYAFIVGFFPSASSPFTQSGQSAVQTTTVQLQSTSTMVHNHTAHFETDFVYIHTQTRTAPKPVAKPSSNIKSGVFDYNTTVNLNRTLYRHCAGVCLDQWRKKELDTEFYDIVPWCWPQRDLLPLVKWATVTADN